MDAIAEKWADQAGKEVADFALELVSKALDAGLAPRVAVSAACDRLADFAKTFPESAYVFDAAIRSLQKHADAVLSAA